MTRAPETAAKIPEVSGVVRPEARDVNQVAPEVRQLAEAIQRSFALEDLTLAEAFHPAHLSIALIDAVFGSGLDPGETPEPAAARYCRRFGLARTREERRDGDDADEEETLVRLVGRYSALGMRAMAGEVFESRRHFPGTRLTRSSCVLRAARALLRIEVERLSDMTGRRRPRIESVLGPERCAGAETARLLLMYTGGESFVYGDAPVRAFVADALGQRCVPAARAVRLVRAAAYELILTPRYVDHAIWRAARTGGGTSGRGPWPR